MLLKIMLKKLDNEYSVIVKIMKRLLKALIDSLLINKIKKGCKKLQPIKILT